MTLESLGVGDEASLFVWDGQRVINIMLLHIFSIMIYGQGHSTDIKGCAVDNVTFLIKLQR